MDHTNSTVEGADLRPGRSVRAEIERRLARGIERSRMLAQAVIVTLSVDSTRLADPQRAVLDSRHPDDAYFAMTNPRGDLLTTAGQAYAVRGCGRESIRRAAVCIRRSMRDQSSAEPAWGSRCAPTWITAIAFDPTTRLDAGWSLFPSVHFVLPEVMVRRRDGATTVTLTAVVDHSSDAEALTHRLVDRLDGLAATPRGRATAVARGSRVPEPGAAEAYRAMVRAALTRIERGPLEKVVLARRTVVELREELNALDFFDAVRSAHPDAYAYCVGRGGRYFAGASPELFAEVRTGSVHTVALAGTTGRGATPAHDARLAVELASNATRRAEQAYVQRWVLERIGPLCSSLDAAGRIEVLRVSNAQHLLRRVSGRLRESYSVLDVLTTMHPTPAVCGYPFIEAMAAIRELEGFDRGLYAGAIGWLDGTGDGELAVALRCVRVNATVATLFAGCGVVRGSSPDEELAETETKFGALLPLLT